VENILKKIVANRRKEVEAAKAKMPVSAILEKLVTLPAGRSFKGAMKASKGMALIAEIKWASPSKGPLMSGKQTVAKLAETYAANGATAISVVTESKFFKGNGGMIEEAKKACPLPVLRKDFIIDPWQLYESKLLRADAVLLIASLFLQPRDLRKMIVAANNLSLTPLVEVHNADDLKKALRAEAEFIGVNNRDLASFKVDLKCTEKLGKVMPEEKYMVSESGILTREDAETVRKCGARGILVGEALIKAKNTAQLTAQLSGVGRIGG
jgi:indole-3-glycerol phosphate synthase